MKKMFQSGDHPDQICLPIKHLIYILMTNEVYKKSHNRLVFNQYPVFFDNVSFIEKNKKLIRHQSNGINNPLALISMV